MDEVVTAAWMQSASWLTIRDCVPMNVLDTRVIHRVLQSELNEITTCATIVFVETALMTLPVVVWLH